jgi:Tol biopolymer transport system component
VLVSASDDGEWLAFPSFADLTGENHDRSPELFLLATDGSQTRQLTDEPAPNGGSVTQAAIAGDGQRVAFVANTDPLGQNPENLPQLFVIDNDGAGLQQLTTATAGSFGQISISDDGTRVAFAHDGDLTGGNGDGSVEVFAAVDDGSDLRQLTDAPSDRYAARPALSGDGLTIAFESDADLTGGNSENYAEIFAVEWDGSGLRQLTETQTVLGVTGDPASQFPSITDDGQKIVFFSNYSTLFTNFDGNFEIFEIGSDGSGLDNLTSTALEAGSFLPIVSGDGSRIAYLGVGAEIRLRVMNGDGNEDRALVTFDTIFNEQPDITDDGTRAVFRQTTDLISGEGQLWRVDQGEDPVRLTELGSGNANTPALTGDGSWVVFSSTANPTGDNFDGSEEIFRIRGTGADLDQLTAGADETASLRPAAATDGSRIVFDSDADPNGGNPDGSREVFSAALDGTDVIQLTSGPEGTTSRLARLDGSGTWAVFESNADLVGMNGDGSYEIFRVRSDGTGLEQLTGSPTLSSRAPDVSDDGSRISFSSAADPVGGNPEGNVEIFVYDVGAAETRQLTSFASGSSAAARISGSGQWVYFRSNAPVFEEDPDRPVDTFRVPAAGGDVQRVGALRSVQFSGVGPVSFEGGGGLTVNAGGERAVVAQLGDLTEGNPDQLPELWWIDRDAVSRIRVGKATPTRLSWDHESGPVRYDAIRGQVAALGFDSGGGVDLGAVVCLEDDSPDADTDGFEDPDQPEPGRAFFFLYRGSPGISEPGSYGFSTSSEERAASSGDCPR